MPEFITPRLRPFGTNIFTTMSRLAAQHDAVNLSQGFPDFDGPVFIKDAARDALYAHPNQYAPMPGVPALRRALAERFTRDTGLPCDADTMVTVTCGCTEALPATVLGLCEPGDEVIFFQPYFDIHKTSVILANCTPKVVTLRRPDASHPEFWFDEAELRGAFTPRTRAIVVNTPHNPTGKVFTRAELQQIADLCIRHNVIAITDEVYERLVYEPSRPHVSLASLPGMAERTVTLSSMGKTFSLTGWKIGWAIAPAPLTAAVRAAHQFMTFSIATPLQYAAAAAIEREQEALGPLRDLLLNSRDLLSAALTRLGFRTEPAPSGYFILADYTPLLKAGEPADDHAFSRRLIERCRVAAIPASVFYHDAALGRPLLRFAFCKKADTIREAIRRLETISGA
jgi:N-succinyldiaminopimelate aminotransferase